MKRHVLASITKRHSRRAVSECLCKVIGAIIQRIFPSPADVSQEDDDDNRKITQSGGITWRKHNVRLLIETKGHLLLQFSPRRRVEEGKMNEWNEERRNKMSFHESICFLLNQFLFPWQVQLYSLRLVCPPFYLRALPLSALGNSNIMTCFTNNWIIRHKGWNGGWVVVARRLRVAREEKK